MRRAEEDIPMDKKNKAVVTVVGNDTIGIIARVSAALAAHNANILDISQTVLSGMFNMMMMRSPRRFPRWARSSGFRFGFSAAKSSTRCTASDGGTR